MPAALFDFLDAFLQEHKRCGLLDAGVSEGVVWMTCECGAQMAHSVGGEGWDSPMTRRWPKGR